MYSAIERQRKVLTTNKEAHIAIECVYEDYDFNYLMKREEFENICAQEISHFHQLIAKAINQLPKDMIK